MLMRLPEAVHSLKIELSFFYATSLLFLNIYTTTLGKKGDNKYKLFAKDMDNQGALST